MSWPASRWCSKERMWVPVAPRDNEQEGMEQESFRNPSWMGNKMSKKTGELVVGVSTSSGNTLRSWLVDSI